MLNPAYAELQRIQSKISTTSTLEDLKLLLVKESADLTVKISPVSVWTLDWNVLEQTVSGVLELSLQTLLRKEDAILEGRSPKTWRVESPDVIDIFTLEEAFIKTLQAALCPTLVGLFVIPIKKSWKSSHNPL